jgi:surface antigen
MPKSTTVAAYAGVFMLVVSLVAIGYRPPQAAGEVASIATTPAAVPQKSAFDKPSVDQLVATNIAAGMAETANLPVAANVAELSISLAAKNLLSQNSDTLISKPQIIQPTANNRSIASYTSKVGDTVTSVAAQYHVSPETVKWANNLSSDAIEVNKNMVIPPVDGVIYTVKNGDTVDSIAQKYKVDTQRIVSFNDLELSGVTNGKQIVLPGGVLPSNERPGYVAPRLSAAAQGAYNGGYSTINMQIASATAGNKYAFGNCTWYVYERRMQLGRPVGSFWGNAATWAMYAQSAGYDVGKTPRVGAVAQWNAYSDSYTGYAGHVAIVESVNSDGSVTVSEMNYAGNFNRVTSRTLNAGSVSNYIY